MHAVMRVVMRPEPQHACSHVSSKSRTIKYATNILCACHHVLVTMCIYACVRVFHAVEMSTCTLKVLQLVQHYQVSCQVNSSGSSEAQDEHLI